MHQHSNATYYSIIFNKHLYLSAIYTTSHLLHRDTRGSFRVAQDVNLFVFIEHTEERNGYGKALCNEKIAIKNLISNSALYTRWTKAECHSYPLHARTFPVNNRSRDAMIVLFLFEKLTGTLIKENGLGLFARSSIRTCRWKVATRKRSCPNSILCICVCSHGHNVCLEL